MRGSRETKWRNWMPVFRLNRRQDRRRDLGTRVMFRAESSNSKTRETPRSSLFLAKT